MKQIFQVGTLMLTCLMMIGCTNESQRLAEMADQMVQMQAEQNTAASEAQRDYARLNSHLQSERENLNRQFSELEQDRRELHLLRRSELAWAESFQFLAIVIAATLPLLLCAYLIWSATQSNRDADLVNEVLIQELVSKRPRLIAGPVHPAIQSRTGIEAERLQSTIQSSTEEV